MNLAVRPASIFTLTRLAQLLNQAFRDYLVEVSFNEETGGGPPGWPPLGLSPPPGGKDWAAGSWSSW
jgi:hypothetical protein